MRSNSSKNDDWEAYIEPDILGRLAHDAKEHDIFGPKDRSFLMHMSRKLKKGQELTGRQRDYVVGLLKQARQKGLLDYVDEQRNLVDELRKLGFRVAEDWEFEGRFDRPDEVPASESTRGGPGVKEPPRDVDLHKKIGPPQKYDDDL